MLQFNDLQECYLQKRRHAADKPHSRQDRDINLISREGYTAGLEDFQSVSKSDGSDLESSWSEILKEPHSRGRVKVVLAVTLRYDFMHCKLLKSNHFEILLLLLLILFKSLGFIK